MSSTQRNVETLRERVLAEVRDSGCEHTGNIAADLNVSPGSARYWLDKLESEGLIEGFKHDERDTLYAGRQRVYWSPVQS